MSVLYIRDKNGDFVPVPALQGEDGGYYVPHVDDEGNLSWTASEVDMPSIASVNIKGKDGEPGKSGVHVDNEEPTDPSVNVWIDPDGEPDGELDDMRVLIDTITVEEDVAEITLNYEPDGTRYNFSSVSLRVTFPACSYTGNVQVVFWINGDWKKTLTSYFVNSYNANGAKVGYTKAWLDDSRWKSGWWNCVNGPGEVSYYSENPYFLDRYSVEDGYIRTIKLMHDIAIPAGTIIELFGVRV